MNEAETKPRKGYIDPIKEAQAAAALIASLRQMGEGEDEALLIDSIEGQTSLLEILDELLTQIAADQGLAEGARKSAADVAARAERFEKRAESARALVEQALMIAEIDKLERPAATLSLVRRGPKVEITEEAEIPAQFWKAGDPKLDRKGLLDALKNGDAVPGACLSNSTPSLTIRKA